MYKFIYTFTTYVLADSEQDGLADARQMILDDKYDVSCVRAEETDPAPFLCDYVHDEREQVPADWWAMDMENEWTPLCSPCLPDFWVGGDRAGQPFIVFPINSVPAGPKRIRTA